MPRSIRIPNRGTPLGKSRGKARHKAPTALPEVAAAGLLVCLPLAACPKGIVAPDRSILTVPMWPAPGGHPAQRGRSRGRPIVGLGQRAAQVRPDFDGASPDHVERDVENN